jgi:RNA polymerase sigma factor (sigma-70 family)
MTLTAESLAGRILAVFSRRSPAFRPPTPPATDTHPATGTRTGDTAKSPVSTTSPLRASRPEAGETADRVGTSLAQANRPVTTTDSYPDFETFYRSYIAQLVVFLVWQGASASDAADLAQETMVDVYRNWSTIAHPNAWARRVASRRLVRHVSRIDDPLSSSPPETTALISSADALAEWENKHQLMQLLRQLPPRQRQILAWSVTGYTPMQIAEELGLSPSSVRMHLHRARRAAARFLSYPGEVATAPEPHPTDQGEPEASHEDVTAPEPHLTDLGDKTTDGLTQTLNVEAGLATIRTGA